MSATRSFAVMNGARPKTWRAPGGGTGAGRVLAFVLGTAWLVVALAPFDYMLVAAFRSQATYFFADPWLPTSGMTLDNVSTVMSAGLGRYLLNSAIVVISSVVLTLFISLVFAFHATKHRTKASSGVFRVMLLGLAVPLQALVVPLFIVVTKIHIYDSLIGLVLIMTAAALPLTIVIMSNFMRDVPDALLEAMRLDGAGDWRILFRLVMPMSAGALGVVLISNTLTMWNNFLIPLLFTQSNDKALLPLGLYKFQSEYGVNVPAVMMAVLVSALPLIILFILTRKYAMQAMGGMATMR